MILLIIIKLILRSNKKFINLLVKIIKMFNNLKAYMNYLMRKLKKLEKNNFVLFKF